MANPDYSLLDKLSRIERKLPQGPVDGGGGPPHDSHMEERVKELERTATDIRERLARMESGLAHVATRADVASVESTLLKWFVGTAIALAGLAFAAARLIH